ncbi:hypothetical protein GCM10020258_47310 [Sphingomonas yabuuchiae]
MVSKAIVSLCALTVIPAADAHSLLDYVGQCVPFARQASGIAIYGDAWTWWSKAEGKYPRGRTPASARSSCSRRPAACRWAMSRWSAAWSRTGC